jgi:hypothetical protein
MHQSHIDTAIAFLANLRSSIEYGTTLNVGRRPFGTNEQHSIELVLTSAIKHHGERDERTDLHAECGRLKAELDDRPGLLNRTMGERDQLKAEVERLRGIINEVNSWAVCSPICTPEDMMQNIGRIESITNLNGTSVDA